METKNKQNNYFFQQFFHTNPDAYKYNRKLKKSIPKSIHYGGRERFTLAQEQKDKPPVPISQIIALVNEMLEFAGFKAIEENEAIMDPYKINYAVIKEKHHLSDERNIIWMKFTKSGHLGVVASTNDINFDMPKDENEYDTEIRVYNHFTKAYENRWKFNSSGIIVNCIGEEWDKSFVLVFPLSVAKLPCRYNRHEVETAIGNYLIHNNVPIIDYYSHNY